MVWGQVLRPLAIVVEGLPAGIVYKQVILANNVGPHEVRILHTNRYSAELLMVDMGLAA